jgi:hypothetical protein
MCVFFESDVFSFSCSALNNKKQTEKNKRLNKNFNPIMRLILVNKLAREHKVLVVEWWKMKKIYDYWYNRVPYDL